jgi:hypothetical protein
MLLLELSIKHFDGDILALVIAYLKREGLNLEIKINGGWSYA